MIEILEEKMTNDLLELRNVLRGYNDCMRNIARHCKLAAELGNTEIPIEVIQAELKMAYSKIDSAYNTIIDSMMEGFNESERRKTNQNG